MARYEGFSAKFIQLTQLIEQNNEKIQYKILLLSKALKIMSGIRSKY